MSTRCGAVIPGFFAGGLVSTVCARPPGHAGPCWPVPLLEDAKTDKEDTADE